MIIATFPFAACNPQSLLCVEAMLTMLTMEMIGMMTRVSWWSTPLPISSSRSTIAIL